ncbi:MAG: HNH endonuclease [Clostridia bacterium]|nr:HNH endonuclease [Clostridia bacterium]
MKKEYKLTFELVPEECWYCNLRSILKAKDWDTVRRDAYARANGRCMICGRPAKRLEAHEKWSYDEERAVQKLEDVVALCHNCHEVKHISRTQLIGRGAEAMEHFMKVNKCSQMEYHSALGEANEEYFRRNRVEGWSTDISWLESRFDIKLK